MTTTSEHLRWVYDGLIDEDWDLVTDELDKAYRSGLPEGVDLDAVRAWIDDLHNERRFWSDCQRRRARKQLFQLHMDINWAVIHAQGFFIELKPTKKQQRLQGR